MSIIKFWLIHYIYILHFIINAYTLRICIHIYVLNIIYIQTYTSLRYWLWTNKAGTRTHTHTITHQRLYLTDSNKSYNSRTPFKCSYLSIICVVSDRTYGWCIPTPNKAWFSDPTVPEQAGGLVVCNLQKLFLLWPEIACTKNVRFQT